MNGPCFPLAFDLLRDRCGVAAMEFAITAPALLVVLGGLADFGLAFGDAAQIEQAAEAGAAYAFAAQQVAQQEVGATISASSVQAVVQASLTLSPSPTVTVTGPEPGCTSTNSSTSPSQTTLTSGAYGQSCPNGNPVGTYVVINVRYTYQPLMPSYSMLTSTNLSATSTVRLY